MGDRTDSSLSSVSTSSLTSLPNPGKSTNRSKSTASSSPLVSTTDQSLVDSLKAQVINEIRDAMSDEIKRSIKSAIGELRSSTTAKQPNQQIDQCCPCPFTYNT